MLTPGQWALVTGASSGLGEAFARQLAARGISVVLTARTASKLERVAALLWSNHGVGTRVVGADLSTPAGIDALLRAVRESGLPIDHLVANAGFFTFGDFAAADPCAQRAMVALHCEAIVALTSELLPGMIARGRGGVVHVASTAAFQPTPGLATFAATKAFVLSFTEALHEELRGTGVHAMALCPGSVPTVLERAGLARSRAQLRWMPSAEHTAARALDAYEHGRAVFVPGALHRLGAVFASLAPRPMARRIAHRVVGAAPRAAT